MTACSFARRMQRSLPWRLPTCRALSPFRISPKTTPRARLSTLRRPSGTRTLTASRSWSTTAAKRSTRSSRTIFTRDPLPKRACTRCFWISASMRAGSAATHRLRSSKRRMKTRRSLCTRARPAAVRARCWRISSASRMEDCCSANMC